MKFVTPLENGIVIDHIGKGKGLEVLKAIGETDDNIVVLAMNVYSKKHGHKDILKLSDTFLDDDRLNIIAIISPNATLNTIKNSKIVEKKTVVLPSNVRGILKCLNPLCITNKDREPVDTSFTVSKSPLRLTCEYCGKVYDQRLATTL